MLPAVAVHCPYCGEPIELLIDAAAGAQRYVEDCPVCCRPIAVDVDADAGRVRVATGDEA
ncbi:CPXCG motif-containing cysteine-rich protein [Cognatiluteimonas weifangensis]|uniref:CPXCG motif-containing cysteine-rich protein n=1 Tax=Cognatiluteimonas weifangensis TaxID=2303539 RepID=A0A372DI10_9GAMM|nr:CPXCG motif-containing cysteine-rich protein [Luteimonas weifangensis]RFP59205.1 CPXCG motif-containing cysteine-rich protein [Luteimonas weifangensis]